ncbi:MAG: ATP-binding cassette domain-containing protein [Deltaproteobacteria bacterium]|nr:ATP-binding cassette domain-containing protein [Deltaproteobacteria bacterium]
MDSKLALSKHDSVGAPTSEPLVKVEGLTVHFEGGRAGFWGRKRLFVHAVENVSFYIFPGETLGLVGESGSGKSTIGRAILRRVPAAAGRIFYKSREITHIGTANLRPLRRNMQLVFQDPYASLNPRMRIFDIVAEPLIVHGLARNNKEAQGRVCALLQRVGLPPDAGHRYPHAFSGGQRQRIGIARALALNPEFIVADEPVSALDVSIRAQIINLMQDLQAELGLTYLFIAHDLAVVRHISRRIAIMYAGKIVELANRDSIYENPLHPYTKALLSAVPVPDPKVQRSRVRIAYAGETPNPLNPPPGCRFQSRCPRASDACRTQDPPMKERDTGHFVACWQ